MDRRNIKLFAGCLTLSLTIIATFAPLTGAQKTDANERPSKTMAGAPAQQRRPSARELIFSYDPLGEKSLLAKQRMAMTPARSRRELDGLRANSNSAESRSNQQQQSADAANASSSMSNMHLTLRDIGPETGFSGSGSGFTFNGDTRQVILPSPKRVFRSVNGGSNWLPVDLSVTTNLAWQDPNPRTEGSYFVRQDPRNPQVLYAVMSNTGMLARSNDFGATWTQLGDYYSLGTSQINFADVAFHEASSNVVLALKIGSSDLDGPALWRSEDGGATFAPQWNSGLPKETFDWETGEGCTPFYSNIATTPADPNLVYVVQYVGDQFHCPEAVHKSIDGGLTFTRLTATSEVVGGDPSRQIQGTAVQVFPHPTRPGVLFVQTNAYWNSSIYRSIDGGESFQVVRGGLPRQNFFVSFDSHDPSLVYVAGRGGVFRSEDSGETFQPLGLTAEQLGTFATNVNVDPSDSKVIYVNTFNGNFKSTNGGKTFTAINNGWRAAVIKTIGFDYRSNPNLYLVTDHGILRTHTPGHDFERVPGPSALNDTRLLAGAPSNPDLMLAATDNGHLYRTLDGGQSWIEASINPPDPDNLSVSMIAFDPQNSNNVYFLDTSIYASPSKGVYKSVDAGATFERTVTTTFRSLAVDPIHPNVIFAGTGCDFCFCPLSRSVDGGLSFTLTSFQFNFSEAWTFDIAIDPQNPNNIFLGGWLYIFREDPERIEHVVLRTTDGGTTFSPVDAGLPQSGGQLVMSPDDPARLYLSVLARGLYMTSDSGNTWSLVPAPEIGKLAPFGAQDKLLINPKKPNLLYFMGSSLLEVEIHPD